MPMKWTALRKRMKMKGESKKTRTDCSVNISDIYGVDELPVKDEIRVKDFTQVEELIKKKKKRHEI